MYMGNYDMRELLPYTVALEVNGETVINRADHASVANAINKLWQREYDERKTLGLWKCEAVANTSHHYEAIKIR